MIVKIIKSYAYMTDAPPPATIVQILPDLFRMVSFRDAPLFASSSAMYASWRDNISKSCHSFPTQF